MSDGIQGPQTHNLYHGQRRSPEQEIRSQEDPLRVIDAEDLTARVLQSRPVETLVSTPFVVSPTLKPIPEKSPGRVSPLSLRQAENLVGIFDYSKSGASFPSSQNFVGNIHRFSYP